MKNSKTISLDTFLTLVKVLRMLYGVEPAMEFFEKNLEEFTGFNLDDFKKSLLRSKHNHDNIQPPRDTKTQENRL